MKHHSERKHSKFSASGSERWVNCPGSVALEEQAPPEKDSPWAAEGTKAHELLETILNTAIRMGLKRVAKRDKDAEDPVMDEHVRMVANQILSIANEEPDTELWIERRVFLDFIDKEAFGTLDMAGIEHFGVLHIGDLKYGKSPVSPVQNLQLIYYALAVANQFDWNFHTVRLHIFQPRVSFKPVSWDMDILELKKYVFFFERAIKRIKDRKQNYFEGSWCHFCKGKTLCPLKSVRRTNNAKDVFDDL